jgi:hypothetical protein
MYSGDCIVLHFTEDSSFRQASGAILLCDGSRASQRALPRRDKAVKSPATTCGDQGTKWGFEHRKSMKLGKMAIQTWKTSCFSIITGKCWVFSIKKCMPTGCNQIIHWDLTLDNLGRGWMGSLTLWVLLQRGICTKQGKYGRYKKLNQPTWGFGRIWQ